MLVWYISLIVVWQVEDTIVSKFDSTILFRFHSVMTCYLHICTKYNPVKYLDENNNDNTTMSINGATTLRLLESKRCSNVIEISLKTQNYVPFHNPKQHYKNALRWQVYWRCLDLGIGLPPYYR